jgi:nucleoside-diphosphate-sugar epimerase
VTGTLNVLSAGRDNEVRRIVYASSSSIYGQNTTLPKTEDLAPAPLSPYAVAKHAGEAYCRSFYHVYGLETVSLRYFNVFGPRQDPLSQYAAVIPNFISAVLSGHRPTIYGDGEQSRDFTYIDNVVDGNLLALTADDIAGQTYNVAAGERVSLNRLIEELAQVVGTAIEPKYAPARAGEVRHSQADIQRAQAELGYRPLVTFRDGLSRTVEHFRS